MQSGAPIRLIGDERYYAEVADNIAQGRGHLYVGGMEGAARAWRPPAHSALLSWFVAADRSGESKPADDPALVQRFLWVQVVLGTLLVGLTAALGAALFGSQTGLAAGLVAALYPALIVHAHVLWSETLFAVLVTASLLGVVDVERRRHWGVAALTGLGFGVAALTREVALPVAGVCALWWLGTARPGRRRLALGQGVVMLGVALLVILPWSARNHALFGRVIPVSTVGWFAAAEGNSLERSDWLLRDGPVKAAFHRDYFSTRDEMQRHDLARRHALERIRAEQPSWLFKKSVRNLALLLNPDSVLRLKIRRGAYGDQPAWPLRMLRMASIPAWIALFVFGVFGVAAARGEGRRSLAVLVFAVVGLLHVFANATPRFRVPWLPLLGIYAANAALGWRSLPRRLSRGGAVAALATLLFFFGVCIPYFHCYGGRP